MEDAETLRAIETLKDLGLLVSLSDLEAYHGRAASNREENEWMVNPMFRNGANASGNNNVNARSALYTSNAETAKEFADTRAYYKDDDGNFYGEIHRIVSADSDATIINSGFNPDNLDGLDRERYDRAISALLLPATEGSPLPFEKAELPKEFRDIVGDIVHGKRFVDASEMEEIAKTTGVDEDVVLQIISALNTRLLLENNPGDLLYGYMSDPSDIFTDEYGTLTPINAEYLESVLRESHIVGVRQNVSSATLGKRITSYSFFDLQKITTPNALAKEREEINEKYGALSVAVQKAGISDSSEPQPVVNRLTDLHASPAALVEDATKVEGYERIYQADAGNWEGYTLAQHTETVLRIFDENFADSLPVELLTPMRLALLVHDIGKPIAAARGEKHLQKQYNDERAEDFMSKLEINDKLQKFILAIIGDSQKLVFDIYIRGAGEPQITQLRELAATTMAEFTGSPVVSKEQIDGFIEMCKILQVCDGGAYTSMAVTADKDRGVYYRNAPSFNSSFAEPIGPSNRDIRPRRPNEPAAREDQTPQVKLQQFRPTTGGTTKVA
jgi:hypothetical protein